MKVPRSNTAEQPHASPQLTLRVHEPQRHPLFPAPQVFTAIVNITVGLNDLRALFQP